MSVVDKLQFGFGRRLPVILQAEAAECGMACLAMVLGYYGRHVDLAGLRRRHVLSLKGMTLRNVMDLAGQMNMATRALRVELEDIGRLRLPCILHWGLNHFVTLERIGSHSVVIHDPAPGAPPAVARRGVARFHRGGAGTQPDHRLRA